MFSDFATPPSTEELTWLQATTLFENSSPHSAEDDINSQSDRMSLCSLSPSESSISPSKVDLSHSSEGNTSFPETPRSEWIYRTPKSLSGGVITNLTPCKPRPFGGHHPTSLSRSRSNASSRTAQTVTEEYEDTRSFCSRSILHPRTRQDPSVSSLRPIPSESQLTFTPLKLTPNTTVPKRMPILSHIKTPSLSGPSDNNLLSHSPTSSGSDSPVTPVSLSSTCRTGRRRSYDVPRHRHRRCSHSTEIPRASIGQSSPSKSILARTASVSTRASSHTANKSVKFATIPTVHYATRAYWDMDIPDTNSVEINIDSMGLDDDPFANYRSREGSVLEADEKSFATQQQSPSPTLEHLKQNPKRVRRLIHPTRNSSVRRGNKATSERPAISSPYPLGSYPANTYHVVAAESLSSLINQPWAATSLSFRSEATGSASSVVLPIKNGLSRSRPSGAISLRSIESTFSRAERFRTWLSRTVGWTPA